VRARRQVKLSAKPEGTGALIKQYACILTVSDNKARIERSEGGDGLWVPYAETKAVIGYVSGAQTWIASGPFSGCEFAVGKGEHQVFGAHIARQSGSTAEADYKKYSEEHRLSEWFRGKIPMPDPTRFSCSYVFVKIGAGGILSMSRMDVNATKMGGSDGAITKAVLLEVPHG
jgi:hypothetical protein